jgi:hypothetical protein
MEDNSKCPHCNEISLQVRHSYPTFKNDDTPEALTECWINREMVCSNPKCTMYNQIVKTISNLEYKQVNN